MVMWDNYAAMKYAVDKGKAEGRAEGKNEGLKLGAERRNREIAQKLLAMNLPLESVMQATGLAREELMELQAAFCHSATALGTEAQKEE